MNQDSPGRKQELFSFSLEHGGRGALQPLVDDKEYYNNKPIQTITGGPQKEVIIAGEKSI